jgi:hypothetical protein
MKSPGRFRLPLSISTLRRSWIVPVAAVTSLLVVALGVWMLVRDPRPQTAAEKAAAAEKVATAARAAARAAVDPTAYVRLRSDTTRTENVDQLIQAYGAWVSRPDAGDARREIIRALVGHKEYKVGLEALLRAVETDQTPRKHDPMWGELVRNVASLWNADTFSYGRDLVMIEDRDKSKELLFESLVNLDPSKLDARQKGYLASDLIDMYPTLKPDQKPAVNRTLHAVAGNDVVEILSGRGMKEGELILKVAAERQRALDEVKRNPVQEAPAVE